MCPKNPLRHDLEEGHSTTKGSAFLANLLSAPHPGQGRALSPGLSSSSTSQVGTGEVRPLLMGVGGWGRAPDDAGLPLGHPGPTVKWGEPGGPRGR